MKLSLRVLIALAAMTATAAIAQSTVPSAPLPAGPSKVAIIAFQPAVAQTNEGQRDFGQIQQKFAPQQAQLKAQNDDIDSLKKQLQAAGPSLSEDARADRVKVISDKEKSLQRSAQDAQADYQQQMSEAYQRLAQKFYAVLQSYCKKNGYTLVVDISSQQSPIVYAAKEADITPAVVALYNTQSGVPAPAKTEAPAGLTHSTTRPHASGVAH
ncbi:MAG TPA: OmpH family outer membrane protein [Acidobacteriaceae bacterium]|jgi:outer membrane protein|nr:OmpH family outer membrane protein [Acidobacteriaceae bacterium]